MNRKSILFLIAILLISLAGCKIPQSNNGGDDFNIPESGSKVDVLDIPESEAEVDVLPAIIRCTHRNEDGMCTEAVCVQDFESDCLEFAIACLEYGHSWEGDKQSGTCTNWAE
ncbi:MAG: hypothetical protein JW963_25230 [Anaerolineales bacterium]|nr:hypothetical protein [Anaerolineales bacterium]